ncbi:hypothetical protein FRC20_001203 [Serendipita sp. 405]|nr:hypothetical protein FRC18_008664 [Serendipita sp. 400]KAG8869571.1 hypothetical protein FRC20_001203 [Serendipita sp. 405]
MFSQSQIQLDQPIRSASHTYNMRAYACIRINGSFTVLQYATCLFTACQLVSLSDFSSPSRLTTSDILPHTFNSHVLPSIRHSPFAIPICRVFTPTRKPFLVSRLGSLGCSFRDTTPYRGRGG